MLPQTKYTRSLHMAGDLVLLNLVLVGVHLFTNSTALNLFGRSFFLEMLLFNSLWIIVSLVMKVYRLYRVIRIERIVINVFRSVSLMFFVVCSMMVLFNWPEIGRYKLLAIFGIILLLIAGWRIFIYKFLTHSRKIGLNFKNVVIIGAGPVGNNLRRELEAHPEYGYKVLGIFDDNPEKWKFNVTIAGSVEEAKQFIMERNDKPEENGNRKVHEIFCALPLMTTDKIKDLRQFAEKQMVRFKIVPDFRGFMERNVKIDFYGFTPVMILRPEPLGNTFNTVIKRAFDIAFSLMVIIFVLSWLLPILAIGILLSSKGPVFYRQNRSGKENKVFRIWKFRTMTVTHSDEEFKQVQKNDANVTSIGRFMRKTNLDELPQFFNVLWGDMSVVGPRPHPLKLNDDYKNITRDYMIRHYAKPGITGYAQIKGYRGETRDKESMFNRVKYDVWYIENWSFLLDIRIIFRTIIATFKGQEGAY